MNLKKINLIYRKSKLFDVMRELNKCGEKIIYNSFFYKTLFHKSNGEKFFATGFIYRILNYILGVITLIGNFFSNKNFYHDSFLKKTLDSIFSFNLNSIILKSISFKFLLDFFGLEYKKINMDKNSNRIKIIFWLLVLIIFFLLINFIGIKKSFLVTGGIIFALLTFYKTKFGIYALAFFIPLLPTKFILAIILLTSFSFVFNLFFDNEQIKNLKFELIDLFVILFATLILYTTFISYLPLLSLKSALVYILFIAFYFVLKHTIKDQNDLFAIVSLFILSSSFVALIGVSQKYLGVNLNINAWIDEAMFSDNKIRVFSTLDNPNVLGEYLLFAIPICLGSIYYFKNKLCKLFAGLNLILLFFCMLLTLSRGAWLGLIFALVLFVLLRDKKFLSLVAFFAFLSPIFIPKSFVQRFMSIGNMTDTSTSYRVGIWRGALKIIKDFWPIGIGLGTDNFVYVYQKYALSASYALHSHNFYLQLLIDFGITGLFLVFAIIFLFYKKLLVENKFLHDNFMKTFKISLCSGFFGYLIQSLTDNTWYNYRIVFLFWFMIGVASIAFDLSKLNTWGRFKFLQHKHLN